MRAFLTARLLAASLFLLTGIVITAPVAHAETMADVATMAGPDRMQRIIEGAKKENALTLYSSATTEDMGPIVASFEKTYGIKVKTWRGSSEDIRQRGITEMRGGRFDADVYETAGTELEPMQREGLMQEMKSPTLADLIPQAIRPHKEWVASRLSTYVGGYNSNLISPNEAPKKYEDLLDPKWKGKLGIEAEDGGWFMALAGVIGEDKAVSLFRNIVETNGMSVRKGHTLLGNLVVSGEVPLALTVYGYRADQLVHSGAPFKPILFQPLIALPTGIAVARKAPHPYAAALFWEHYLTEGQKILVTQDNLPVNTKVKPAPAGLVLLDPAQLVDQNEKWTRLYRDIFSGRPR